MSPLQHRLRSLREGNLPISALAQRTQQGVERTDPPTMTGNKPNSHKKRAATRHNYKHTLPSEKKRKVTNSTDPLVGQVVTQTQCSPPSSVSASLSTRSSSVSVPSLTAVVSRLFATSPTRTVGSPLADDAAIAEMASGGPLRSLNFGKSELLHKHKKKEKRFVPFKLDGISVYPWLRKSIVTVLKADLKDKSRKPSNPTSVLRTSRSFFETISYSKKTKVAEGHSSRIAAASIPKPIMTTDLKDDLDFDSRKVSDLSKEFDWSSMDRNFSLDSRKLRRYIVEDLMFSKPSEEPLLLLVSPEHPSFETTWLPRYRSQKAGRLPIQFCGRTYLQIDATVLKNSTRCQFIDGMYSQDDVLALLTSRGGAGVGLHFTNCHRSFDLELKFASVIEECDDLQVWGVSFSGRNFLTPLAKLKDDDSREAYFTRYLKELNGDHGQTQLLASNYKLANGTDLNKDTVANDVASTLNPLDACSIEFGNENYTDFVNHVDTVFRKACDGCYGRFVSLTDPIVSQATMKRLSDMFKAQFPVQYATLAKLLNYEAHFERKDRDHLHPFYDRMILYQFMSICRVRSHKAFSWWALVNACMRYGCRAASTLASMDSVFFGHSITQTSVMRKTKTFREITPEYYQRIIDSLAQQAIAQSVFDNAQTGIPQTNQRHGKSSIFLKMTAKMFVEMQYHWEHSDLTGPEVARRVVVRYLDQAIPSPMGMPRYELMTLRPAHFAIEHFDHAIYAPCMSPDFTGKRVAAFVDLVFLTEEMKMQQKFLSRPNAQYSFVNDDALLAYQSTGVMKILQQNRSAGGLYERAHKFQRESVVKWKGRQTPVKLLCCPLSVDDETTTEGCGNVMLSLLEMASIIKVNKKSKKIVSLSEHLDTRWQITYGDGLSQMRVRGYTDTIDSASTNFRDHYEQSTLFSKALDRVVMVPGDLHGGGFHFLGVVYILFYGAFLQPIQYALGWKRIRGSDVSKTYQQSASLALMVLNEVERGLYGRFISDLVVGDNLHIFVDNQNEPKLLAEYLGRQFILWLQKCVEDSTDEVLRMIALFTIITRKYRVFRESVRCGDAIVVEYLYEYFIPLWLMTGKQNYVEIGLSQIEDLYGRVPYHILQVIRENRMLPIHPGKDRDGRDMAHWAMDALMELMQPKYKSMNFPSTLEGWQNHSTNMPLVARCKRFAETEYRRRYGVSSYDEQFLEFVAAGESQDIGNVKTQSKVPRRTKEKIMVSEILTLADVFVETPGRKFTNDTFWKVLKNITSTLVVEKKEDRAKEGRSEGEVILAKVNRELLNNEADKDEVPDEVEDMGDMDLLAWEERLQDEDEDDDGLTEEPDREIDEAAENTGEATRRTTARINVSDKETVVQVGKTKSVLVRKAKMNPLAVTNIIENGQAKIRLLDIPSIRYRSKMRVIRERKTLQQELDHYLASQNGSTKFKSIIESLKESGSSDHRVEYRLMMKQMWIAP
jgi:hypothetical protein